MLDDWMLSGQQMKDQFLNLAKTARLLQYIEQGCLEINLVAAASSHIKSGLRINQHFVVPVKAYYAAKDSTDVKGISHVVISGLHSSANYGFDFDLRTISSVLKAEQPAISSVQRRYSEHRLATL